MPATGPDQAKLRFDQQVAVAPRALDHDRREPLGAALVRVGADDDDARVRALPVPARDVARPVLAPVEDVLVALAPGGHTDAHRVRQGGVEPAVPPGDPAGSLAA